MPASTTPLVYCETNWFVDIAFPHREHHPAARALLDAAREGRCALQLPLAALLEARRPLKQEKDKLVNDLNTLQDRLRSAALHGFPGLSEAHAALNSNEVRRYVDREPPAILDEIRTAPGVDVLADVPAVFDAVEEIRREVPFDGRDVVDLYVLATVLAHRRQHSALPAIFFSTDARAFGRSEVKALCTRERLLWRSDFALGPAISQWRGRFEAQ
jgi:predicted nucleic acid-binding protein